MAGVLASASLRAAKAQTPAHAATVMAEMDSVSLERVRGVIERARASG
ncbi:MAG: hypothetical protein JWN53_2378, partial [Gemmatimonadetes bacterium]|nr:hypothetical protein [Gemmatimonadota bacterium]